MILVDLLRGFIVHGIDVCFKMTLIWVISFRIYLPESNRNNMNEAYKNRFKYFQVETFRFTKNTCTSPIWLSCFILAYNNIFPSTRRPGLSTSRWPQSSFRTDRSSSQKSRMKSPEGFLNRLVAGHACPGPEYVKMTRTLGKWRGRTPRYSRVLCSVTFYCCCEWMRIWMRVRVRIYRVFYETFDFIWWKVFS